MKPFSLSVKFPLYIFKKKPLQCIYIQNDIIYVQEYIEVGVASPPPQPLGLLKAFKSRSTQSVLIKKNECK